MAGELSDYAEKALVDHIFAGTPFTPPTQVWLGISTTAPNDDGTNITEPSGFNYSRVSWTGWGPATGRQISNVGLISFPTATGGSWGTPNSVIYMDAQTDGNYLGKWVDQNPNEITDGETYEIQDGQAIAGWTAGLFFSNYMANAALDHLFNVAIFNRPAALYLGFSSTNPTDDASGITEPSGGSYARPNASNWTAAAAVSDHHQTDNSTEITTPVATADWLTGNPLPFYFLNDAATAGNMLTYGALDSPVSVQAGERVRFNVGSLVQGVR